MTLETYFHVIKDPVHGTMQFTAEENNWIKPFIDSPPFQRLRHIKQLGMGDFIFPGAVHTRFNHSIGCCYIGSQIGHKIGLTDSERQLVMIACLLHDIGHGPFSHTFEDIFTHKKLRHEMWTPSFLKEYHSSAFLEAYNHRNPLFPLSFESLSHIEAIIMHKSAHKSFLSDIVSSQLDADRLDYLLRDSHFCGVTYGEFDYRWMINSMTIVDFHQQKRLGLTHKGIGGVEHYLMARRLMMRNIYYHPKKLAIESYLVKLLIIVAENIDHEPLFSPLKNTRLGVFLTQANQFNGMLSKAYSPHFIAQFIAENYENYRELNDYDIFALVKLVAELKSPHAACELARHIQHRQMPSIIRLDSVDTTNADQLITFFKKTSPAIQDWQLHLIKTPHQSYTRDEDPILIKNGQNMVKPLTEISLMIDAISDKLEPAAFLCVDKHLLEEERVKRLIENIQLNS